MRRRRLLGTMGAGLVTAGVGVSIDLSKTNRLTEPLPAAPIIDLHAHVAGSGAGGSGCWISPGMQRNWRFPIYLRAFGVTAEEVQRHGDELVVERIAAAVGQSRLVAGAVLLALDGVVRDGRLDLDHTEVYIPNDFVARATARHPGLYFGASIHPGRRDAIEQLQQAAQQGAVLVKWLPNVQQFDPVEPAFLPFLHVMRELNLPLLVHTGSEYSYSRADDRLGDPERLRPALEAGVTVIAAHGGGGGSSAGEPNFDRLLRLMARYTNLYTDIAALTQINRRLRLRQLLRRPQLHGRLLYGSDFPLIRTALVSPWYFLPELGWAKVAELAAIANPWDRDVLLKQALGVPAAGFARPAQLLGLAPLAAKN